MADCAICRNERPQDVLLELAHVWVTAQVVAALPGYVCVVAKRHVNEQFELDALEGHGFWDALMRVARGVRDATGAAKINYEIHGNTIRHLHCHVFPRYPGDPFEGHPIDPRASTFARSPDDLARLRTAILAATGVGPEVR